MKSIRKLTDSGCSTSRDLKSRMCISCFMVIPSEDYVCPFCGRIDQPILPEGETPDIDMRHIC
jgi:hypothetical protein